MRKVSLFIVILLIIAIPLNAFASVLGTSMGEWKQGVTDNIIYNHTIFQSNSTTVGQQAEYYYDYTPNKNEVPIVVNGSEIYGKRTLLEAEQYMVENNMKPIMGINADYFSFVTGIPMGHTIINGDIVTKDPEGQNAVGFNEDGTGFISWLEIVSTMKSNDKQVSLDCINKWCQPGSVPIYMMTDAFGDTTRTSQNCLFVIMSPKEGRLKIGSSIKLTVDDKFEYCGDIAIPEGKFICAVDKTTWDTEKIEFLNSLNVGDEVTIKSEAVYDNDKWSKVEHGISSVGGRLIENGTINTKFEAGVAPRTAVGITAEGHIIFYVIDGRQPGHSYGVQLKTLAKRMAELGCVDAINLDGGGSTSMGGMFEDKFMILNKPSEGTLRACANFIFLQNKNNSQIKPIKPVNPDQTQKPQTSIVLEKPENTNYLSGAKENIYVKNAVDENGNIISVDDAEYKIENFNGAEVSTTGDGVFTMQGSGYANITVSTSYGDETVRVDVYENPENIKVYNKQTKDEVLSLNIDQGNEYSVDLDASSYVNNIEIHSNDRCYEWEVTGDVGTITDDGEFQYNTKNTEGGSIFVKAGNFQIEIPVVVQKKYINPFADTNGHWAEKKITSLYEEKIIRGSYYEDKLIFRPDDNMTRAEFSAMVSDYLKLDLSKYENTSLEFSDNDIFSEWMIPYIKAMTSMGIVNGKQNGDEIYFAPNDTITRAEAMTILGRIIKEDVSKSIEFTDSADIPSWAKKEIEKLYGLGVINGYADNTILPNNKVKRAEAVSLIYNLKNI